jgi:hypothetical protein
LGYCIGRSAGGFKTTAKSYRITVAHSIFHRIRHYGLFANTRRAANIARLRQLLGFAPPPAEELASPSQDEPAEAVLPPCPCCGGRMIVVEFFERGTQPRCRPPFAAVIWFDTS